MSGHVTLVSSHRLDHVTLLGSPVTLSDGHLTLLCGYVILVDSNVTLVGGNMTLHVTLFIISRSCESNVISLLIPQLAM